MQEAATDLIQLTETEQTLSLLPCFLFCNLALDICSLWRSSRRPRQIRTCQFCQSLHYCSKGKKKKRNLSLLSSYHGVLSFLEGCHKGKQCRGAPDPGGAGPAGCPAQTAAGFCPSRLAAGTAGTHQPGRSRWSAGEVSRAQGGETIKQEDKHLDS